jgi:hypothetical protein
MPTGILGSKQSMLGNMLLGSNAGNSIPCSLDLTGSTEFLTFWTWFGPQNSQTVLPPTNVVGGAVVLSNSSSPDRTPPANNLSILVRR